MLSNILLEIGRIANCLVDVTRGFLSLLLLARNGIVTANARADCGIGALNELLLVPDLVESTTKCDAAQKFNPLDKADF